MPRTCSAEGCNNSVFSHNFCRYHQYMRKKYGGDLYNKPVEPRSPSKRTKVPRRTKERATDEKYYTEQAKEFFNDAVNNGTNLCFFCGEKVTKFEGLHHLRGRTNQGLLDFNFIVTVHNKCHVEDYHMASAEQRTKQPWWNGFMSRLRLKSNELYLKEIKKIDKSGILFENNLDI